MFDDENNGAVALMMFQIYKCEERQTNSQPIIIVDHGSLVFCSLVYWMFDGCAFMIQLSMCVMYDARWDGYL
jgi:hypothetical protein